MKYSPNYIVKAICTKLVRSVLFVYRHFRFKEYHYSDVIIRPILLTPQFITMEENVSIFYHARIEGISYYGTQVYKPNIILRAGVSVQQNLHLTCANSIIVGNNTAIAANVTITDIHHPYKSIDTPIEKQDIEINNVVIGPDCKIYNNVVILPGTIIGKHVTVGANSVVSGVFPDYCVIVGSPARIVKRYDEVNQCWRHTDSKGAFVD